MTKNTEAGVKGSTAAAHEQMSNDHLMGQPLSLTSPLTRVRWGWARGRRRERRGKEDLSWFDVTIYQGTGECDGWERDGGSSGNSGRERERETWCVALSAVAEGWWNGLWYWLLIFPLPSAERTEQEKERSSRGEQKGGEWGNSLLYWKIHNHCRCP